MKMHRALIALIIMLRIAAPVAAKPNSSSGSQSGLDRTAKAIELHRINSNRPGKALTSDNRNVVVDLGNVSIMHDDGTLILPLNIFDLSNRSLTFTPQETNYAVQAGPALFDMGAGASATALSLEDD